MKILFHIFGLPIHFLGLMVAVGMLAGVLVAYLEIKRKGLDKEKFFDIALYSIISAIIGARVFYILFYNLSFYVKNPIEIFKITEGGLSIHGGILGALIFALFYFRKHKLNFLKYADAIAPGIILGQGIGRVGCDVFGKVMNISLPWGIERQGQLLHPAQVYEFILDYLVFFVLYRKRKHAKYDGQIFVWYVILFSINRGIVELFRNNPSVIGWFSVSHLLSLLFIIGAVILMFYAKRKNRYEIPDEQEFVLEGNSNLLLDIIVTLALMAISLVVFYMVQS